MAFVHKQTHHLCNGDGRVGVVELDGPMIGKVPQSDSPFVKIA
jgi:hypothetical protein